MPLLNSGSVIWNCVDSMTSWDAKLIVTELDARLNVPLFAIGFATVVAPAWSVLPMARARIKKQYARSWRNCDGTVLEDAICALGINDVLIRPVMTTSGFLIWQQDYPPISLFLSHLTPPDVNPIIKKMEWDDVTEKPSHGGDW